MTRSTTAIQEFRAATTDGDLDELRARLAAARLPEPETVQRPAPHPGRWEQGVPLTDLVDVVNYWRTDYDWRSFEERLNRIGQFRTTIDGLGIHFLHRRSPRADATPLIMTHGWPGSVAGGGGGGGGGPPRGGGRGRRGGGGGGRGGAAPLVPPQNPPPPRRCRANRA
ncbi:epoxide hydrolase N-terminal domain-containing protein, partial [Nocardia neocaledoniensis]|uniref:epoxide hydrolase N-terminal domain-containing protein n=1 Tax=Nocardia neocaledoniensis TaxID=236511 RepID=UPI0024581806